jgi:hypothetical protein
MIRAGDGGRATAARVRQARSARGTGGPGAFQVIGDRLLRSRSGDVGPLGPSRAVCSEGVTAPRGCCGFPRIAGVLETMPAAWPQRNCCKPTVM